LFIRLSYGSASDPRPPSCTLSSNDRGNGKCASGFTGAFMSGTDDFPGDMPRFPFDDRDVAREELRKLAARAAS